MDSVCHLITATTQLRYDRHFIYLRSNYVPIFYKQMFHWPLTHTYIVESFVLRSSLGHHIIFKLLNSVAHQHSTWPQWRVTCHEFNFFSSFIYVPRTNILLRSGEGKVMSGKRWLIQWYHQFSRHFLQREVFISKFIIRCLWQSWTWIGLASHELEELWMVDYSICSLTSQPRKF